MGRLHGKQDRIQAVTALGAKEQIATAAVTLTGRITQFKADNLR